MTTMYLGPSLKGVVRHNQIFTYYPGDVIEQACKISPLAKELFVDIEHIVSCKNELKKQGSFLYLAFQKVEKSRR